MRGGESRLTIILAALLAVCSLGAAFYVIAKRQAENSEDPSPNTETETLSQPGDALEEITVWNGSKKEQFSDRSPGPPIGKTWIGFSPPENVLVFLEALAEQRIYSGTEVHPTIRVAEAWAVHDPDEAVQWALGLPEHLQMTALSTIFTLWVRSDPAGALDSLMKSENEELIYSYFPGVVNLWSDQDPPAALEAIRQYLSADDDLAVWTGSLLGKWAQSDAGAASVELDRLLAASTTDEAREELINSYRDVATAYSQFSLDSARAWIETIDSPEAQWNAVEGLMPHWLQFQPEEATKWIKQQSRASLRDPAIVGLINYTGGTEPLTAFQWAGEISDPGLRSEYLIYTGSSWLALDPETAGGYLANEAVLTQAERAEIFEDPDLAE